MVQTVEHNYFQTCWRLSDSKTFNKRLSNTVYQFICKHNYKYIFVKIARKKLSELSNFPKFKLYFYYEITSLLILNTAFFSRAKHFILTFKEKIHSIGLIYSFVSSKHLAICLLKMALEHRSIAYF